MKRAILILAVSIIASGCRDDSERSSATPAVEYSNAAGIDAKVANYTNADWLYQNYFGEYGLPVELKSLMLPELQMIANGFALQLARGEDVQASISHLDQAMQMLHYSGQFGLSLQQMEYEYTEGAYDRQDASVAEVPPEGEVTVVLDDETRANLAEAERLDAEYARQQEELVQEFSLPYALPDRTDKYVTYSPAMKSSGTKNTKPNTGSSGRQHQIKKWDWWEGDVAWTNGAGGVGHMGIVDTNQTGYGSSYYFDGQDHPDWQHEGWGSHVHEPRVIDANTGPGVSMHRDIDVWANKYSRVEGLTYTQWKRYDWNRSLAVRYAINLIGVPYNWVFWNKKTTDKTYCSQLIWQAYKDQGVDLDRDGGLIVWPEDIRSHRNILRFNASSI